MIFMKITNYLAVVISIIAGMSIVANAQTVEAYQDTKSKDGKSFFDPSKLTVNHSLAFGMSSSSQQSGLQSQSLYSTMLTYQFSQPLTLGLNFSLPIHSTYNSNLNLTPDNVQSLDYFKNLPFDAHLRWQPTENFAMQISIIRNTGTSPYYFQPFGQSPYRFGW